MKILYVEDNPRDADLAMRHLLKVAPHFQLETIATFGEAAARLERLDTEPLDLVLTDVSLPDGDGLALLAQIRDRALSLAVVVITGTGDEETVITALKAGADDYVTKRKDYLEHLPLTLESALERHRATASLRARPLRVLYAEHDPQDVALTRSHFSKHASHIHLDVVTSGPAVFTLLQSRNGYGEYDVLLLDNRLPGHDALEMLKELRLVHKLDLPVVLVTSQGSEELALQSMKLGVTSYMVKNPGYLHQLPSELEKVAFSVELSRREKALRESEERNRAILRAIPDLIFLQDKDGRYLDCHAKDPNHFYLMPEQFLGKKMQDVLPPDLAAELALCFRLALETGETQVHEYTLPVKDEHLWFEARIARCNGEKLLSVVRDITERLKVEDALNFQASLLNTIEQAVVATDMDGVVIYWNQFAERLFGWSMDEAIGREVKDLIRCEDVHGLAKQIWDGLRKGQSWAGEFTVHHRDGSLLQIWVSDSPIHDARGHMIGALGISHDITDRKLAEEALKESEEQVRIFVEHTPVAVAMFDREMRYLLTSRRWLKDNKLGEQDIIGRYHYEVVPYIPERWKEGHERCLAGAVQRCEEDIFERPDGTIDWVRWEIRPWYAASGEIGGIIMFSEIITERKQSAEALRASEERFAKVFKANPQPMSLTTFDEGLYIDVNESFLNISGYTRDEVIGHTSLELNLWETPADRADIISRLEKQGVLHNIETKFRTKSGAFRVFLSSIELLDITGQRCILVASSDITERKKLEDDLLRLTVRLFNIQDEERRRIARELHDGTAQSLFAISVNLTKLQQQSLTCGPEQKHMLEECQTLCEQSLQEIRTLSYLLHPPLLDQAGLVSALQWYVEGFIKRSGIYVDLLVFEDIGRLPSEIETALFRIVQESLTNIHRHSGSDIASIRLSKKPSEIILQIKDQGRGLPKRESSESVDEVGELGVGIPGMRQRLRQLGGKLEIESGPQGTTITGSVPLIGRNGSAVI